MFEGLHLPTKRVSSLFLFGVLSLWGCAVEELDPVTPPSTALRTCGVEWRVVDEVFGAFPLGEVPAPGSDLFAKVSRQDSAHVDAPINPCLRNADIDGLLDLGLWPLVAGRVEAVEPVLSTFRRQGEAGNSDRVCETLAESDPALRVSLRVERSSWDLHEDALLILVFDFTAFHRAIARPSLTEDGELRWEEGNNPFPVGARIGARGGLLESGEFYTRGVGVFQVGEDGRVGGYIPMGPPMCVMGTLDGRDIDALMEQARAGWDGEPPLVRGYASPIATCCHDHARGE